MSKIDTIAQAHPIVFIGFREVEFIILSSFISHLRSRSFACRSEQTIDSAIAAKTCCSISYRPKGTDNCDLGYPRIAAPPRSIRSKITTKLLRIQSWLPARFRHRRSRSHLPSAVPGLHQSRFLFGSLASAPQVAYLM